MARGVYGPECGAEVARMMMARSSQLGGPFDNVIERPRPEALLQSGVFTTESRIPEDLR